MAREYRVVGYRNTRYRPGVAGEVDFDRPFSQAVFEELYSEGDPDVIPLQEVGAKFNFRSIYNKPSIRVKAQSTQKDIIFQIDYLKIEAIHGGEDRECVYFFVDSSQTRYIDRGTALLMLTIDEQTTADCTQFAEISGMIEKRNISEVETGLNLHSEDFEPTEPLMQDIAYITAKSGKGYTVVGGIPKMTGVRQFISVHCDLGQVNADPPKIAKLPPEADGVMFTMHGGPEPFTEFVPNMVLVDAQNQAVREALTKLQELGASDMIGSTYSFPNQVLASEPATFVSHGIPLITGITGGLFAFTVDNMPTVPAYSGMNFKNKKAGYQFTMYSITAPASGETQQYELKEIINSASNYATINNENIKEGQLIFTGTGVPMSEGAIYWKASNHVYVNPVPGYDARVHYINAVRGSNWNDDGLALRGIAHAELLAQQLSWAKQEKDLDDRKIEKIQQLSTLDVQRARAQTAIGMVGTGAGFLGSLGSGNAGDAFKYGAQLFNQAVKAGGVGLKNNLMPTAGDTNSIFSEQEKIINDQAELAKRSNALGLEKVQHGYDYAQRTQSLAVSAPTGLDMNRIMGSSALITRWSLTPKDAAEYDLRLTWGGTTVKEHYKGKLKDHEHLFEAGEDFSYIKLGTCTLKLPGEPSGWANTSAWASKIHAEMQTGGRYWKKKYMDYEWDQPIPDDEGTVPVPPGYETIYFESLEGISDGDN